MAEKITPPTLKSTFNVFQTGATLQTIVAPAANTKGVVVLGAWVSDNTGMVSALTRVMAKTTAPTGANDVAANTLAVSGNAIPSGLVGMGFPVVLAPGVGLYAQGLVGNANAGYGVEYEVL